MRKIKLLLFLTFYILSSNFLVFAGNKSEIILKIENEIITNFDLRNKILSSLILSNQEINQNNINSLKNQSLDLLILYKLKKIELDKYDYTVDQARLNSYLNSISSNNVQNLKNIFLKYEVDFDQFLNEVKVEFKWKKFIYNNYSKKIEVDENIVNEEIKKRIKNNRDLEEFKLSKIEIFLYNDGSDDLRITSLQNHIKNYGFESAINKFDAQSPDDKEKIAWISGEALSKNLKDIVKNLNIDQVSDVIKLQDSVIILKLLDKRKTKINTNDIQRLRKNIINKKKNDLFSLYSSSHLSKLKNSSFISYK